MYFPVFVDLSQKEILVVGAGTVALRRIRTLCGFAGHITVVALQIPGELRSLAQEYPISVICRSFEETDLDDRDIVLAATDDAALNARIGCLCRARATAVNVCSDARLCDFQFPSVVETGDVVIGINASGKNHHLVKTTRQMVEKLFEQEALESKYR